MGLSWSHARTCDGSRTQSYLQSTIYLCIGINVCIKRADSWHSMQYNNGYCCSVSFACIPVRPMMNPMNFSVPNNPYPWCCRYRNQPAIPANIHLLHITNIRAYENWSNCVGVFMYAMRISKSQRKICCQPDRERFAKCECLKYWLNKVESINLGWLQLRIQKQQPSKKQKTKNKSIEKSKSLYSRHGRRHHCDNLDLGRFHPYIIEMKNVKHRWPPIWVQSLPMPPAILLRHLIWKCRGWKLYVAGPTHSIAKRHSNVII